MSVSSPVISSVVVSVTHFSDWDGTQLPGSQWSSLYVFLYHSPKTVAPDFLVPLHFSFFINYTQTKLFFLLRKFSFARRRRSLVKITFVLTPFGFPPSSSTSQAFPSYNYSIRYPSNYSTQRFFMGIITDNLTIKYLIITITTPTAPINENRRMSSPTLFQLLSRI